MSVLSISLIGELDEALRNGSPEKRVNTLRRVTSLFMDDSDHLSEQQIGIFDDVLVHLVQRIESRALVELSKSLAPIECAPIETVRALARHDEITIAGPVLAQSTRLTERDLVEIAKSKAQGHLLAISGRQTLTEAVTDVLIERGDREVSHRLAGNAGARFSRHGFAAIVSNAAQDDVLAERLGLRLDIPLHLLSQLLSKASELVRSRLLASASPEKRDEIQRTIDTIAFAVGRQAAGPRNYKAAESVVQTLNRNGQLNEKVLVEFLNENRYEEAVATLALFCGTQVEFVERMMKMVRPDGIIIACKSAKLSWPTVNCILKIRHTHHSISSQDLEDAKKAFIALSQASAQRTFRFMLVQDKAKVSHAAAE